jgi:hypothetical protein
MKTIKLIKELEKNYSLLREKCNIGLNKEEETEMVVLTKILCAKDDLTNNKVYKEEKIRNNMDKIKTKEIIADFICGGLALICLFFFLPFILALGIVLWMTGGKNEWKELLL